MLAMSYDSKMHSPPAVVRYRTVMHIRTYTHGTWPSNGSISSGHLQYSAAYRTRDQQRVTVSEVAPDCCELMVLRSSIVRANGQLS